MSRESTSSSEAPKRAPRKRVARSVPRVSSSSTTAEASRRKAPTSFYSSEGSNSKSRKKLYISLAVLLSGFLLAIGIGYSDKGQIDIAGVITERNAKVTSGETIEGENSATSNTVVPVQNNNNGLPDGGLVGAGSPPPPEPVPEEVATSTDDESATTTDESTDAETEEAPDEEISEVDAVDPEMAPN